MGAFLVVLGHLGRALGGSWGLLGWSWDLLGTSWGRLGRQIQNRARVYVFGTNFWIHFGGVLARLGRPWGRLGGYLCLSWGVLGLS